MVLCISAPAAALPLSSHSWNCNGEYFPALICFDGNQGSFRGLL